MSARALSDRRAVDLIAETLDDTEDWSADTLDDVVLILAATGRAVAGEPAACKRRLRLDEWAAMVAVLLVVAGMVGNVLRVLLEVIG